MKDSILSGKYRLCHILGQGRSSIVYLAVHQELQEYRAVKCVRKDCMDYPQFLREAHLLRDLKHPCIPVVYDLAEDEEFSYLIEEYVSGDTLQAVVSTQGPLSLAMTIQYGIQICRLVDFLHSDQKNPILHLDLQPKNLLLSKGVLKLVDFGQAVCAGQASVSNKRYGTVGYAAPEQYTDDPLEERTDIYAIGAVLYYMSAGQAPGKVPVYSDETVSKGLKPVIRRCLEPDRERRYASAKELGADLQKLAKTEHDGIEHQADSFLTIAVTGTKCGIGTTHTAIGLVSYLQCCGIFGIYEEKNSSNAVRQMADWFETDPDENGYVQIKGLTLLPRYGPAFRFQHSTGSHIIMDYGTDWAAIPLHDADMICLVCGSRWWEQSAVYSAYEVLKEHPNLILLYNHTGSQRILLPSRAKKQQCFPMPYFPNPFKLNSQAASFYKTVLNRMLQERRETDVICCEHSFIAKIKSRFTGQKKRRSVL